MILQSADNQMQHSTSAKPIDDKDLLNVYANAIMHNNRNMQAKGWGALFQALYLNFILFKRHHSSNHSSA